MNRCIRAIATFLAVAVSAATASACYAQAEGKLGVVAAPVPARPTFVLAPDFPKDQAAPAEGVNVQVTGTVGVDGRLDSPEISAAAGLEAYVDAVKKVLPEWRFSPRLDSVTCAVAPELVTETVTFEGSAADPRISVTWRRRPASNEKATDPWRVKGLHQPHLEFPMLPASRGIEGTVRLALIVDPSGHTSNVSVWERGATSWFDEESVRAGKRVRIEWDPAPAAPVCATWEINYCLEPGDAVVPDPECAKPAKTAK